jgi:hypothetical protein
LAVSSDTKLDITSLAALGTGIEVISDMKLERIPLAAVGIEEKGAVRSAAAVDWRLWISLLAAPTPDCESFVASDSKLEMALIILAIDGETSVG